MSEKAAYDADTTYESLLAANGIAGSSGLKLDVLDPNVLAKLETGTKVLSMIGYGESFWTHSYRVAVELPNGEQKDYFLKVAAGDTAAKMMHGEHESQKTLYELSPTFVPQPIAWGAYKNSPDTYFFLCDFINMTGEIPGPGKFCKKLAELHLKSMENPPESGFGFHMSTAQGNIPLNNNWNKSWELFFTEAIKHMMIAEEKTQGTSKEIGELKEAFLTKVIPRLLRPLENKIKPCIVHGDLWHGNTSVAVDTMEPLAFDSCVLWAHNEYEMGIWRAARYKFGRTYIKEYHKYVPVSEPEEEWDDRNTLYGIRVDLLCSALYGSSTRFRELAIIDMKRLIDKYPEGIEDYQENPIPT